MNTRTYPFAGVDKEKHFQIIAFDTLGNMIINQVHPNGVQRHLQVHPIFGSSQCEHANIVLTPKPTSKEYK